MRTVRLKGNLSEDLTPELERIEELLCCGYNQKQVADILGKSYQTVKNQSADIYAKRNIGNQTLLLLGYLKRKGVDLAASGLDKSLILNSPHLFCSHVWLVYSVAVRYSPQSIKFGEMNGPAYLVERARREMMDFAEGSTHVVQRCQHCKALKSYSLPGTHNNIKVEWPG